MFRILVAEDDDALRQLFCRVLNRNGFSAIGASDGQEALDLLEKEYRCCQKIQDGILTKAKQIYSEQKQTGTVFPYYCNFAKLEAACDAYGVAE